MKLNILYFKKKYITRSKKKTAYKQVQHKGLSWFIKYLISVSICTGFWFLLIKRTHISLNISTPVVSLLYEVVFPDINNNIRYYYDIQPTQNILAASINFDGLSRLTVSPQWKYNKRVITFAYRSLCPGLSGDYEA